MTNKVTQYFLLLSLLCGIVIIIGQVLLFFKFYDPIRSLISYIGHSVEPISKKFGACMNTTVVQPL